MALPSLSIEDLPVWARLNNVTFTNIEVTSSGAKGYGVVCQKDLTTADESPNPTLLTVPRSLTLNQDAIEEYAKEDRNFRQLLDVVGRKVPTSTPLLP